MKPVILMIVSCMLLSFGVGSSLAQTMPDYVIRTAQEINAIYGEGTIDINSTGWDWRGGSLGDNFDLSSGCTSPLNLPASTAATGYYRVFFDTDFDGNEEWAVVVYDDYTYFGLCRAPRYECGTLAPRLSVGNIAHISPDGFPNNLRSIAGESGQLIGEIPAGAEFLVVDGPRCASGISFWLVEYNNIQGWTAEGQGADYYVLPGGVPAVDSINATPIGPTATPAPTVNPTFICNGVVSRLYAGLTAQVTPGIPNNLRAQPGESGQYLGEIPPGIPFTIVAGPECNSNIIWWQVNYQGTIGWTGEAGSSTDYWLEPIGIGLESINTTTVERLNPVAELPTSFSSDLFSIHINPLNTIVGTWSDGNQLIWQASDPTLSNPATSWSVVTTNSLTAKLLSTRLHSDGQAVMMTPSSTNSSLLQIMGSSYFNDYNLSRDSSTFDIGAFHPDDGDMLVVSPSGQGFMFVDSNPNSATFRGVSQAARILLPNEIYTQLEFSRNGQRLIGLTDQSNMVVWSGTDSNPATWTSNFPLILSDDVAIYDLTMSPDGTRLLIAGERILPGTNTMTGFYTMYSVTLNGAEEIETVYFNSNVPVQSVEFTPDGSLFVVVSSSSEMIFFDTSAATEVHRLGTTEQVTDVVFDDGLNLMVTVSNSNQLTIWRIR